MRCITLIALLPSAFASRDLSMQAVAAQACRPILCFPHSCESPSIARRSNGARSLLPADPFPPVAIQGLTRLHPALDRPSRLPHWACCHGFALLQPASSRLACMTPRMQTAHDRPKDFMDITPLGFTDRARTICALFALIIIHHVMTLGSPREMS